MNLQTKTLAVINSCLTLDQLSVAINYITLAIKVIGMDEGAKLYKDYWKRLSKITEQ